MTKNELINYAKLRALGAKDWRNSLKLLSARARLAYEWRGGELAAWEKIVGLLDSLEIPEGESDESKAFNGPLRFTVSSINTGCNGVVTVHAADAEDEDTEEDCERCSEIEELQERVSELESQVEDLQEECEEEEDDDDEEGATQYCCTICAKLVPVNRGSTIHLLGSRLCCKSCLQFWRSGQ